MTRRMMAGLLGGLGWIGGWAAALPSPAQSPSMLVEASPEAGKPYDVKAERFETSDDQKLITARGTVYIRQGRQILTAGFVQINRETEEAYARDHVVFVRADGSVWKGDELRYNFKTGIGDFGKFMYFSDPYYIYGEDMKVAGQNRIELKKVELTTCEGDDREAQVKAKSGTLTDKRYIELHNVTIYLGPVPILWIPVYKRDLQGGGRWDFTPGYSSRLGAFLLSSYTYPLNDAGTIKGSTFVNLYSERGVGGGQNFKWKAKETNEFWRGSFQSFYVNDTKLYKNDTEEEERKELLDDNNRYRVHLDHTAALGERDSMIAEMNYLSDPWVLDDFFRRDFRDTPQPENRVSASHRGDHYLASLLVNARLNDFYQNVDRLPEARLSVTPYKLGDTPFYYESESSASFLRQVYPDYDTAHEDYDAFRADSRHMLSYPGRYFGFLGLTPRGGWRGTYYSKTLGPLQSVTNAVTLTDTNGVTTTTNEVGTLQEELGGDLRNVFELGFESSFKAYKVLDPGETAFGNGLRHVFEPYLIHTYIPEPDLLPENLYQFDAVDRVDQQHTLQLGLRNKLQTRRNTVTYVNHSDYKQDDPMKSSFEIMDQTQLEEAPTDGASVVHDLLLVDVGTTYLIYKDEEAEAEDRDFGPVYANARIRPSRAFRLDFKALYDQYDSQLTDFNGQMSIAPGDAFALSLDYLYRLDRYDQIAGQLEIMPRAKWSVGTYARYSVEESAVEEYSAFLRHRMDCIGWGIGVRVEPAIDDNEEDDYTAWFTLWLLDLPGSEMQLGG